MVKIKIERTKKGYPALWERGGGLTNTGRAHVICAADGSPKKPIYIRRRGPLACGEHALFIVQPGDVIVKAEHHRRDFRIEILEISSIKNNIAECKTLATFDLGEWDHDDVAARYCEAVQAAQEKATCYHCREPHYFLEDDCGRTGN